MQNKPTTIKELCEFIWYLEKKYDLIDLKVDGVKFWQYARMQIYYKLSLEIGLLARPHGKILTGKRKLRHIIRHMGNSLKDNYFTLKQSDIVVLSHPRTVEVDGKHIDIYTKYLLDDLRESKLVLELESAYLGLHKKLRAHYAHYVDWIVLAQRVIARFFKVSLTKEQVKTFDRLSAEIETTLDITFNLKDYSVKKCKMFKSEYFLYKMIFKKIKPKKIFLVVSYSRGGIISASKDLGIEVNELQHGTFSDYHLGYSFPGRTQELDYFPDKFYVWSEYWKNILKLPLEESRVIVDKFRYLEDQKGRFSHVQRNEKQLVVLSQGAIGNAIAQKVLENIAVFRGYKIMYKLHPGEFDRWRGYPALRQLNDMESVKVIKNEIPLYRLFASSAMQVGVFSTAIYEGVEFGCKTILLNLPGIEYMDKFIDIYHPKII